jgi:preprotein translocase subunit YajC
VTLILIYVVVFGALMMFMTTRGRKKQANQAQMMQHALVLGAEVRTVGGLVGTVVDLTDEYVVVETTPGVKLKFTKQSIAGVVAPEEVAPEYGSTELTAAEEEAAAQESAEAEPEDTVEGDSADAKDQQKVG